MFEQTETSLSFDETNWQLHWRELMGRGEKEKPNLPAKPKV